MTEGATGRRVAQETVKRAAVLADRVRRPRRGVVALAYHRVGERSQAPEIDLPAALFARQIADVAPRATTLDDALELLASATPPPTDAVVVTFDDGTDDFVDFVVPVLVRHRVPAVLYVATAFVDEGRAFPGGGRPASWSALRDAVSTGLVTLGSHTHTHALLDRAGPRAAERELDRSLELLGERAGVRAVHFAYPKALRGSAEVERVVRSRFRSAALAGTRPNPYGRTDPYRLARSPVQRSDGMAWFRQKLEGGMALEDGLRRVANRVRYAGARS